MTRMSRRSVIIGLAVAPLAGRALATSPSAVPDFVFESIDGGKLDLAAFRGGPVLVVNTASRCMSTPQYEGLQALWERYRDRGLVLVGVPSNDFGGQEPGSNAEIKTFCEANFDVDFPMTEKVHVKGTSSHPLFAWLRRELGEQAGPGWNFYKFLIGPDGKAVAVWPSAVEPDSGEISAAIEPLLTKPAS